jgi:hypothetical protein
VIDNSTFTDFGNAATDIATGEADQAKAAAARQQAAAAQTTAAADLLQGQGDVLEGQAYGEASSLAELNAQYTEASTGIQEAQAQRQQYQVIGNEKAEVAGAGLKNAGTAADLLRSSVQQGALNQAITVAQGQITVAGYNEQAQSYTAMQGAANLASQAQTEAAAGEQDVAQSEPVDCGGLRGQREGQLRRRRDCHRHRHLLDIHTAESLDRRSSLSALGKTHCGRAMAGRESDSVAELARQTSPRWWHTTKAPAPKSGLFLLHGRAGCYSFERSASNL